jgi:hypothetical protein
MVNPQKIQKGTGYHSQKLWGKALFSNILVPIYCKDLAQSLAKIGKALKPQHFNMTKKNPSPTNLCGMVFTHFRDFVCQNPSVCQSL